jgi:hypothetical protein
LPIASFTGSLPSSSGLLGTIAGNQLNLEDSQVGVKSGAIRRAQVLRVSERPRFHQRLRPVVGQDVALLLMITRCR